MFRDIKARRSFARRFNAKLLRQREAVGEGRGRRGRGEREREKERRLDVSSVARAV